MNDASTDSRASDGVLAAIRATPVSIRYLLGGMLPTSWRLRPDLPAAVLVHRGVSVEEAGLGLVAYSVGDLRHHAGRRARAPGRHPRHHRAGDGRLRPAGGADPDTERHGTFWALLLDVAWRPVTQAYRPAASVLLAELMPEKFHVMSSP